jgi:hypothetical protein
MSILWFKDNMAHRGWYFFFHMKGPAMLPIEYPDRTIALAVEPKKNFL